MNKSVRVFLLKEAELQTAECDMTLFTFIMLHLLSLLQNTSFSFVPQSLIQKEGLTETVLLLVWQLLTENMHCVRYCIWCKHCSTEQHPPALSRDRSLRASAAALPLFLEFKMQPRGIRSSLMTLKSGQIQASKIKRFANELLI